ncbi:MAG: glycosyltransferase [Planctomycetes bacterium]|nr:glycosyltransferase [Planctomycetota bacterium]
MKPKLLLISKYERPEIGNEFDVRRFSISTGTEAQLYELCEWSDLIIEQEFADLHSFHSHLLADVPRPKAIWLYDSLTRFHLHMAMSLYYDRVFVAQTVGLFISEFHSAVEWLPYAVTNDSRSELAITIDPGIPRDVPVGFCGNTKDPRSIYRKRNDLLDKLAESFGDKFKVMQAWGRDYSRTMNRFQIGINISVLDEANMKNFEIPAAGAMLVTNRNQEVSAIFKDRENAVMYDSPEHCVQLVRHYLEHPEEREEIARRGTELVLSRDSYLERYRYIAQKLISEPSGKPAWTPKSGGEAKAHRESLALAQELSKLLLAKCGAMLDKEGLSSYKIDLEQKERIFANLAVELSEHTLSPSARKLIK